MERIVNFELVFDLIRYPPFIDSLFLKLFLISGRFCLDKIIALGPLKLFKAISHASKVSIASLGLKTVSPGIDLSATKCSIG